MIFGQRVNPFPEMNLSGRTMPFYELDFGGDKLAILIGFAEMSDYWNIDITLNGVPITSAQAMVENCNTEEEWHMEVARIKDRLQKGLDRSINTLIDEDPDFIPGERLQELETSFNDLIHRLVLGIEAGKVFLVDQEPVD